MEIATRLPRHRPSSPSLILLTLFGWPIWPIDVVPELFTTAAEYLHHHCLTGVLPLCKSTRLKTVAARAIVSVNSGHLRRQDHHRRVQRCCASFSFWPHHPSPRCSLPTLSTSSPADELCYRCCFLLPSVV